MMHKYAGIIVDIVHKNTDREYTYLIPEDLCERVSIGTPVRIPFGNADKLKKGYVVSLSDSCDYDPCKIKKIDSIAEKDLSVEDVLIELAVWIKETYGCTFSKALQTVLPVRKIVKKKNQSDPVGQGRLEYKLHEPTENQKRVIDSFKSDYDSGVRKTYLLYGITGSGKTDVYINMIRHVMAAGKKVILLIPEISLTYQTMDRIYAAFGKRVAIIHSKLSPGERYEQISKCLDGSADIIVGPRSAVFAPFHNLGLIVVDEEHDSAYKNENVPRYSALDIAIKRAGLQNASVVLASATPSPGTYLNAIEGRYGMLKLSERPGGAKPADIEVVDMRAELREGNRSIFSNRLNDLIIDRLSKKEQIILFLNRRGYSDFVSCRSCGDSIRCPHCDVTLTVHEGHRMKCHYCGYEIKTTNRCPSCGSPYIAEFGAGTQKLERLTRKMYPSARVARLDTDTASGKKNTEKILNDFRCGETDILIGTQMVVKGHDFHNVTLVGIMAAETTLYISNYSSAQRTYELIAQAAGRAGRGNKPGTVVIQTYKPEHYSIENASRNDYESYFKNEIAFRELLSYPPAVHVWTIQLSSTDEKKLESFCSRLTDRINTQLQKSNVRFFGPVKPQIYKLNDYYRMMFYLKSALGDELFSVKKIIEMELSGNFYDSKISVSYDFS